MKTGISSIITEGKLPVFEGLKAVAEAGFDCVEFSICNYSVSGRGTQESFLSENWEDFANQISKCLKTFHLNSYQSHASWGHTTDLTEYISPEPMLYRQMEIGKILGNDYLVFHPVLPRGRVQSLKERKKYIEYNCRWFSELAEYAAKTDIGIAVENVFSAMGNEPQEGLYPFGDAESLLQIVDSVNCEKMGICLDTGHANLEVGSRIDNLIDSFGKYLKAVHINENVGRRIPLEGSDLHLLPTGAGIHMDSICKALKNNNFNGVLSFEIVDRSESPERMLLHLKHISEVANYYANFWKKNMDT